MMLPAGARGETLARPGGRLDGRSVFRGAFRPARFAMLPGIVAEAIRGRYTGGEAGTASVAERAAVEALTAGMAVCYSLSTVRGIGSGDAGPWALAGPACLLVGIPEVLRRLDGRDRQRPAARTLPRRSGQVFRGRWRLCSSSKFEPARMSTRISLLEFEALCVHYAAPYSVPVHVLVH